MTAVGAPLLVRLDEMPRREFWVHRRWVPKGIVCAFCGEKIPPGKPGRSRGTRGTKAWLSPIRNAWECIACRSEGFRAEEAFLERWRSGEIPRALAAERDRTLAALEAEAVPAKSA